MNCQENVFRTAEITNAGPALNEYWPNVAQSIGSTSASFDPSLMSVSLAPRRCT